MDITNPISKIIMSLDLSETIYLIYFFTFNKDLYRVKYHLFHEQIRIND